MTANCESEPRPHEIGHAGTAPWHTGQGTAAAASASSAARTCGRPAIRSMLLGVQLFTRDRRQTVPTAIAARRDVKCSKRAGATIGRTQCSVKLAIQNPGRPHEQVCSAVNAQTCAAYGKHRGNRGGARRDLETLRAAVNHHANESLHRGTVGVSLPPKGEALDRWLTRKEAARLIWQCWRYREKQTIHAGGSRGTLVSTHRRLLRHIAKSILIGVYTGTQDARDRDSVPLRRAWPLVRRP